MNTEIITYMFNIIIQDIYKNGVGGYSCRLNFKELFKNDIMLRKAYSKTPVIGRHNFKHDIIRRYARQYYCIYIKYYDEIDADGNFINLNIYNPDGYIQPTKLLEVSSIREIPRFLNTETLGQGGDPDQYLRDIIKGYSPSNVDSVLSLQNYYWQIKKDKFIIIRMFSPLAIEESIATVISYDDYEINRNKYSFGDDFYISLDTTASAINMNNFIDKYNVKIAPSIVIRKAPLSKRKINIILSNNYTINSTLVLNKKVKKLKTVFYMQAIIKRLVEFINKYQNINLFNILSDNNVIFSFLKDDINVLHSIYFVDHKVTNKLYSFGYYSSTKLADELLNNYDNLLIKHDFYFWLQLFFGEDNKYLIPEQAYDKNYKRILLKDANDIYDTTPNLTYAEYMNYCNKHLPKVLPMDYLDPRTKIKKRAKLYDDDNSDDIGAVSKYISGDSILSPDEYNSIKLKIKLSLRQILKLEVMKTDGAIEPTDKWNYIYKSLSDANTNATNKISLDESSANRMFIITIMKLIHIAKIIDIMNSFAVGFFLLKVCIFCKYDNDWELYKDTFSRVIKGLLQPDFNKQMTVPECINILRLL